MKQGCRKFHCFESRDAVLLCYRERVLVFFEDEEGPRAYRLNNNPQLQIEGFWVDPERIRQPSFERASVCFSARFLPGV